MLRISVVFMVFVLSSVAWGAEQVCHVPEESSISMTLEPDDFFYENKEDCFLLVQRVLHHFFTSYGGTELYRSVPVEYIDSEGNKTRCGIEHHSVENVIDYDFDVFIADQETIPMNNLEVRQLHLKFQKEKNKEALDRAAPVICEGYVGV